MTTTNSNIQHSVKKKSYTAILKKQLKYYRSIIKNLLENTNYNGKFVAIMNEEIIGVGDDELELVEKVQLANPGQVILVKGVFEQGNHVEFPSVEVIE